jgi:hypothetical protein
MDQYPSVREQPKSGSMARRLSHRPRLGTGRPALTVGAGSSLLVQFALSAGYALPVIVSLLSPSSDLARLVAGWNRLLQPVMRPIFELIGPPPCHGDLGLYQAYVRLIVVDAVIATVCYLACTPFWGAWATRLRQLPRWAQAPPERREADLEIGQGLTLAGAIGAAWALISLDPPFVGSNCATVDPWQFLRVPLIITVVYGLACFTAAFGAARAPDDHGPF